MNNNQEGRIKAKLLKFLSQSYNVLCLKSYNLKSEK